MSPVGQLLSAILHTSSGLHAGFHPPLAETSLAAGLERSAVIAITASVSVLLLSALIAYALPRARPDKHDPKAAGLFAPLMFTTMFLFLPLSLLLLRSNFLTRPVALVLIYVLAVLPVCISQLHGSLNRIPRDVADAARIDGCSVGELFRHIVLPIIAPSLVVTILYSLIAAWSLCVIAPSILQIPGLLPQTNGFDSAAVGSAMAPLVVLSLIFTVYLVRNARAVSRV